MQQQVPNVTSPGLGLTFVAARTRPAQAAATAAGGSVAFVAVATGAAVETADPEPAGRTVWNQDSALTNRSPLSLQLVFAASHRVHSPLPGVQARTSTARSPGRWGPPLRTPPSERSPARSAREDRLGTGTGEAPVISVVALTLFT